MSSPSGGPSSSAVASSSAHSGSSGSSSSTYRGGDPEALRRMSKVVNSLLSRGDSGPFREPVDWRGLELYDYPKIIKKMMDLGTVKRKLERGQYSCAHECAEDVRLIWINCKTYNADGSDFFLLAESFSRRFEDRYKKIKADFDTGEDAAGTGRRSSSALSSKGDRESKSKSSSSGDNGGESSSLEARAKFGSGLFKLTGTELGHVMRLIDLRCPQALVDPDPEGDYDRDGDSGVEVEIDVEAIDPRTFAELERYVREKVSRPGEGGDSVKGTGGKSGGGTMASSSSKKGKTSSSSPGPKPKRRGSSGGGGASSEVNAVVDGEEDDDSDEDEDEEEWQDEPISGLKKRKRG